MPPPWPSASSKMPRSSIPSSTCALHHAAHLVSDPLSATRYPPWPRVEGLDRGATRHLPIARSRVPPLGREAIITIAHQYPLWALATAVDACIRSVHKAQVWACGVSRWTPSLGGLTIPFIKTLYKIPNTSISYMIPCTAR